MPWHQEIHQQNKLTTITDMTPRNLAERNNFIALTPINLAEENNNYRPDIKKSSSKKINQLLPSHWKI